MRTKSPDRKTPTEQGCFKHDLARLAFFSMRKKNKAPASVKDPQATFAPPLLTACPGCQSAPRPKVTPPTHTTKRIIPGSSAAPCLLLSTCSARGHCVVLVPRNKRKEQSTDAIYGMQLNLRRCFTLLSLTSSARSNRLLLQSVLLSRVAGIRGTELWRNYWSCNVK